MKILIIRLSSIGDCVLATPVVDALREAYPEAHLTWAVQAKSAPVVRHLEGLSEVIYWDDRHHRYRNMLRALYKTWRSRFDIALDLQGLDKAGLFALASRAHRRISGEGARNIAYWSATERAPESGNVHARISYLRRAALLGIAKDAAERFFPRVPITSAHRRFADEFLLQSDVSPYHRLVGLNLGAAHAFKRWPIERFALLANELLADDAHTRIVVFGSGADAPLLERFEAELATHRRTRAGMAWPGRVLVTVGKLDLMQLAAIAERCASFVTADTGPMHVAAAVGAPIVALFGPTDSGLTSPVRNPGQAPIMVLDARTITGSWPAPMETLEVGHVYDAVNRLTQLSFSRFGVTVK